MAEKKSSEQILLFCRKNISKELSLSFSVAATRAFPGYSLVLLLLTKLISYPV